MSGGAREDCFNIFHPRLFIILIYTFFISAAVTGAETPGDKVTRLEHFELEHHGSFSASDLLNIRRDLMNVRREVGRDFAGYFPKKTIPVVLTDPDLFQSELTMPENVSGLFNGKIHIPIPDDKSKKSKMQGVLWHEYTHALIYELAGNKAPRWYNEGMAVYQESKKRNSLKQRDESVSLIGPQVFNLEALEDRLSSDRYDRDMLNAYNAAYAYCRYLFERFAKTKQLEFLRDLKKSSGWKESL
ncbi:MAG: collagenase, partial [Candidatus Omnitrophica bacterium]|nr:collagenase [Candidatus Omnitrophota bacterium]